MRDSYRAIEAKGATVVVIGTGDAAYARDMKDSLNLPFDVLVDDEAVAAAAASIDKGSIKNVLKVKAWTSMVRTMRNGHFVGKPGKRVNQLGATFVIAPGNAVPYEFRDPDTSTHAPLNDVIAAIG